MSYEVFTQEWAEAWSDEIRRSEAYRKAAAGWEGGILFEMPAADGSTSYAVYTDLWHGECREARVATEEDRAEADYVIRAQIKAWRKLLAGDLDPMFGLMTGKLELARGSVTSLMPFIEASKELVAAAVRIDSTFPDA